MALTGHVSVVIPPYDAAGTIARCLDSVAAQTALPAEVIVVNDASVWQRHRRWLNGRLCRATA